MKHLKRLQKLEEKAEKIPDALDEELAFWLEMNPPEHISINPNSYNKWIETIPPQLYSSFMKWTENIREYIQYLGEHIHCDRYLQKQAPEHHKSLPQTKSSKTPETISISQLEHLDCNLFRI